LLSILADESLVFVRSCRPWDNARAVRENIEKTRRGDESRRPRSKTWYITNFVSGYWAFGNAHAVAKAGGAFSNEENDWQPISPSVRAFLDSPVGCCADEASLVKALLDREHIANRLTCIPGHIFNEVEIGDHWHVTDASLNLFLESSWEDLYALGGRERPVGVLMFPHSGLAHENSPDYRPMVGSFRLLMLMRMVTFPDAFRNPCHPGLPEWLVQSP